MAAPSAERKKQDPRWKALEEVGCTKRQEMCVQAMQEIIGGAPEHMPRMGLCLSGGGWRAMTSGCAMFDALSVHCPNTASGKKVKPLDCFSHAFGLSGGSWMLFNTMAGAARGWNPFHATGENPWLYGENNYFDPARHTYQGLVHMVNKDVVDEACCRGNFRKSIGFLSTRIGADSTIAAVLASKHLGPTLVERWASFISQDLLGWMDSNFQTPGDVVGRIDAEISAVQNAAAAKLNSAALSVFQKDKAEKEAAKQQALEREWKLRATYPSQNVRLSQFKQPIMEGQLPFIVCCAIANRAGVTQEMIEEHNRMNEEMKAASELNTSSDFHGLGSDQLNSSNSVYDADDFDANGMPSAIELRKPAPHLPENHHKRIYDWVEFSPFFARNAYTEAFYPTVDEVQGNFADNDLTRPLYMHHLMAICGSAFACDLSCALPTSIQAKVTKGRELSTNPLIGRGTTTVSSANNTDAAFGECRDAGIDFNIPLPGMLSESGREFDIIVVMDAGSGSKNAHELQRAVDLGYVEAPRNMHPHRPFGKGKFVKVYRHPRGPSIIYFLGLCDRGTHQIISTERLVRYDCARLRERVHRQLVPTIIAEMNRFKSRHERKVSRGLNESASGTGDGELDYGEMDETVLDDGEEGDEDDNLPVDEAISEEVKTVMLSAAATGKVKNEVDAFHAAEDVIVFSNRASNAQEKGMALFQLESHAVSRVLRLESTANLNAMHPMLFNELTAYQVIIKSDERRTKFQSFKSQVMNNHPMVLADPWVDYYAAMGLASALFRSSHPALLAQIKRDMVPPSCTATLSSIPIHTKSKLWTHLATCIKDATAEVEGSQHVVQQFATEMMTHFQNFLQRRHEFGDEDKARALENFATAMTGLQMDDQLIGLLSNTQQISDGERRKVAECAARTGNLRVLGYLTNFPAALDHPSVLAAAYGCPDPAIAHWLKNERKLTIDFLEACREGWFEAVSDFLRDERYQDNKDGGWAALTNCQELVANTLYSRGSPSYKSWLAAEVKTRDLPWNTILLKAGLDEAKPRGAEAEAPKDFTDKAMNLAASAQDKAEEAKRKASKSFMSAKTKLGGFFGKK